MKKVLKRSLSLLLAITIIFGSMYVGLSEVDFDGVFVVRAKAASESDLTFQKVYDNSSKGYKVTDCNTSANGQLSIPSKYDGEPVSSIGDFAFSYCKSLTSVIIPNTVIIIENRAFSNCTKLHSIIIPDSVTSIGNYAFYYCTSLTSVNIPDGVTSIGDEAFYYCESLTSITIPDSVTNIGDSAFYGCSNLTDVYYGGTEADWANIAIDSYNNSLTNANIHFIDDILTFSINADGKSYSLTDCDTSVNSVVIPESYNGKVITSIGSYAFSGCTSLKTVTIPESVTSIGNYAFSGCTYLEKVYWNAKNVADLTSSSNVFYNAGKYSYSYGLEIVFGDSVERIPAYLCYVSSDSYRPRVSKITIGNHVKSIGSSAFRYCNYLGSVITPESVTSIGDFAFSDSGLYFIVLGNGVTSIGSYVFNSCASLTSVTIPSSVTSIGSYAFNNCSSLTDVFYGGTESVWSNTSIGSYNTYLSNAEIHFIDDIFNFELNSDGESYSVEAGNIPELRGIAIPSTYEGKPVTDIGYRAFENYILLQSITIPESVINIDSSAFYDCTYLEKVYWNAKNVADFTGYSSPFSAAGTAGSGIELVFGDDVERIPARLCYQSSSSSKLNITRVVIGKNIKSIGENAFYNCASITEVYVTDVASWCEVDFANSYSNPLYYAVKFYINEKLATNVIIPETVTEIKKYAFYKCLSIKTVEIGDGVTDIGESAFDYCNELVSVVMGENIKNIDGWAFAECRKLESVYISDLTNWCNIDFSQAVSNPLYYAGNLYLNRELVTELVIPYSVTSIDDYVFYNCKSLTSITIPDSVTSIGYYAFYNCKSLSSITVPDSVISIGDYVFYGCSSLKDVYYTGTQVDWANITIGSSNSSLTNATIHCHVHSYNSEWIVDVEPTCTKKGLKHNTCLNCGKLVVEEIPYSVHNYSTEWTIDVAPTCTEEGSKSHHCTACGDKADVTVIAATGHNHVLTDTAVAHPHTNTYTCTFCGEEETEPSVCQTCIECNFALTLIDSTQYKLVSYIGAEVDVVIPAEYEGIAVTTIANSCFKGNTEITSVEIEEGITSIGSLAFMNCTSLEKVVIPASVTSIGTQAFYGFNGTIYCTSGSAAHEYAVANNIKYVLETAGELQEPIQETENTQIDYENFIIRTSAQGVDDIAEILGLSESAIAVAEASFIYGNLELYGTGTIVTVFDGNEYIGDFTLVVEGDINGDSVCNVLDAMHVALVSNGQRTLDGAYAMAADSNSDDIVDVTDYQSIVNKAVS